MLPWVRGRGCRCVPWWPHYQVAGSHVSHSFYHVEVFFLSLLAKMWPSPYFTLSLPQDQGAGLPHLASPFPLHAPILHPHCYNPGPGSTNFLYPPVIPTPSAVTINLPANVQPTAPVIPPSFTTAIPEIPITWPTRHTHQYSSMEYLADPAPVVSDSSDEDSPMRTRSPSPAVELSSSPAVVVLEAHEQPSPPWQAWLSQPGPSRPERRSISPSSEESAPKRLHHNDRSYTPSSPSAQSTAASPNVDSPPMQITLP